MQKVGFWRKPRYDNIDLVSLLLMQALVAFLLSWFH
jgi:hypothetical protein